MHDQRIRKAGLRTPCHRISLGAARHRKQPGRLAHDEQLLNDMQQVELARDAGAGGEEGVRVVYRLPVGRGLNALARSVWPKWRMLAWRGLQPAERSPVAAGAVSPA